MGNKKDTIKITLTIFNVKKSLNLILFFACCNFLYVQEHSKIINIQNLDINTKYADFGDSFYKNNLVLFASSKKDRDLKRKDRSHNRMEYLQFYKGRIADDGQIISKGPYSKEKYTIFHESDIISADGKTIYFTLNNYIQDDYRNLFIKSGKLKSHTDSRAPDEYNMKLSKRRVNSSVAYIISQGINSNRISGEGYGKTRLINRCSNNVKCSEAEHQKNRRTEFIVMSE